MNNYAIKLLEEKLKETEEQKDRIIEYKKESNLEKDIKAYDELIIELDVEIKDIKIVLDKFNYLIPKNKENVDREEILGNALTLWKERQTNIFVEESSELIIELSAINKIISKANRNSDSGLADPYALIKNIEFQKQIGLIMDELADVIVVCSQFQKYFEHNLNICIEKEILRLERRICNYIEQHTNKKFSGGKL